MFNGFMESATVEVSLDSLSSEIVLKMFCCGIFAEETYSLTAMRSAVYMRDMERERLEGSTESEGITEEVGR